MYVVHDLQNIPPYIAPALRTQGLREELLGERHRHEWGLGKDMGLNVLKVYYLLYLSMRYFTMSYCVTVFTRRTRSPTRLKSSINHQSIHPPSTHHLTFPTSPSTQGGSLNQRPHLHWSPPLVGIIIGSCRSHPYWTAAPQRHSTGLVAGVRPLRAS